MMRRTLRKVALWVGGLVGVAYAFSALISYLAGPGSEQCRRLKDAIDDEQLRDDLIRWVDEDLERPLRDWQQNGPFLYLEAAGSPGAAYFKKHDFDLSQIGFEPEDSYSGSKIGLVTWNPRKPHRPRSIVDPDDGLEFLVSITRSVSFSEVNRVAILVRILGSPDFGVDPEYIVWQEGRLAVYCEPRND